MYLCPLFLTKYSMAKETPLMKQYNQIKSKYLMLFSFFALAISTKPLAKMP